jgi:hypothetical protein
MPSPALIEKLSVLVLIAGERGEYMLVLTLPVEQRGCGDNGTVLAVQVGERHGVDVFGAPRRAVPMCTIEGEAAIGDKVGSKIKIAGHAHGRFDRVVCDHAHHNQGIVTHSP